MKLQIKTQTKRDLMEGCGYSVTSRRGVVTVWPSGWVGLECDLPGVGLECA